MIVHHYHELKLSLFASIVSLTICNPIRISDLDSGMSILVCPFRYVKSGKIWLGSLLETPPGGSQQVFFTSVYHLYLLCILKFLPLSFENTQ